MDEIQQRRMTMKWMFRGARIVTVLTVPGEPKIGVPPSFDGNDISEKVKFYFGTQGDGLQHDWHGADTITDIPPETGAEWIDTWVEPTKSPTPNRADLKLVFMTLGNRLVTEHGFIPATSGQAGVRSTWLIAQITEFLNNHEEAQQILMELGFEWPVVQRPKENAKRI